MYISEIFSTSFSPSIWFFSLRFTPHNFSVHFFLAISPIFLFFAFLSISSFHTPYIFLIFTLTSFPSCPFAFLLQFLPPFLLVSSFSFFFLLSHNYSFPFSPYFSYLIFSFPFFFLTSHFLSLLFLSAIQNFHFLIPLPRLIFPFSLIFFPGSFNHAFNLSMLDEQHNETILNSWLHVCLSFHLFHNQILIILGDIGLADPQILLLKNRQNGDSLNILSVVGIFTPVAASPFNVIYHGNGKDCFCSTVRDFTVVLL